MCTMWYLRLDKNCEVIERISLFDLLTMFGIQNDVKKIDYKLYLYNHKQTDGTCIVEDGEEKEDRRKYVKRNGIERLDEAGNVVEVYADVKEASAKLGISRQYINNCLNGYRNNKHRLRWR